MPKTSCTAQSTSMYTATRSCLVERMEVGWGWGGEGKRREGNVGRGMQEGWWVIKQWGGGGCNFIKGNVGIEMWRCGG